MTIKVNISDLGELEVSTSAVVTLAVVDLCTCLVASFVEGVFAVRGDMARLLVVCRNDCEEVDCALCFWVVAETVCAVAGACVDKARLPVVRRNDCEEADGVVCFWGPDDATTIIRRSIVYKNHDTRVQQQPKIASLVHVANFLDQARIQGWCADPGMVRGSRDGAPPTQWACLEKSSLKLARKHPRRMELINILDSD